MAMTDPLSLDFDDLVEPANLVTLATTPRGVSFTLSRRRAAITSASSAPALPPDKNDDSTRTRTEPSDEALAEMPEIDGQRFRRRPGRGHHVVRSVGEIVTIEADLWSHFGSAKAVNDALRRVIADAKKASGS